MRLIRKTVALLCVLAAGNLCWAQGAGMTTGVRAAPAGKPQPILEVIPAGTLGFVAVPNVGKSLAAGDQYLKDIGVADLMQMPGDLLTTLKGAAQLGDGFNAEGGFAAAMLDPQPFGIDLLKMIKEGKAAGADDSTKVPFVLFVPGAGVKEVFGAYKMTADGALTKVDLRSGTAYMGTLGGYVVLSPNPKAVQAVLDAKKNAAGELSKDDLEAIAASNLAVHANVKALAPLITAAMKEAMAGMGKTDLGPMANVLPMAALMDMYTKALAMVDSLTYTVQIGKTGLTLNEYVTMAPDSPMGKALAGFKPTQTAALDRLPDLPYVLAVGGVSGPKVAAEQWEMIAPLLKNIPGFTDTMISKMKKLSQDLEEQITASQMVIGGAPENSGVFGFACVMTCNDSQKVKDAFAQVPDLVTDVIQSVTKDKDITGIKIAYVKDAEKVDSLSVDAIEISHPNMAEMDEEDKAGMKKVLGEDKIRIFLAAPDKNTLVLTFGGSTTFLAEALKAAKGGGAIPKAQGVADVMKLMPKQPQAIVLLEAGHLLAVVTKGAEAIGIPIPPFQVDVKTPLAIGAGMTGQTAHAVIFIPNDLVKAGVQLWGQAVSGEAGPRSSPARPRQPVRGGESF